MNDVKCEAGYEFITEEQSRDGKPFESGNKEYGFSVGSWSGDRLNAGGCIAAQIYARQYRRKIEPPKPEYVDTPIREVDGVATVQTPRGHIILATSAPSYGGQFIGPDGKRHNSLTWYEDSNGREWPSDAHADVMVEVRAVAVRWRAKP